MRGRFDEAAAIAVEPRARAGGRLGVEQLASLHADRGDAVSLGQVADVLRRDFPQRAASWYFAASASFLRGDVEPRSRSCAAPSSWIQITPTRYNLLGAIRATAGDIGAARDAFRTSLRLDPRDAVTYVNLAQLELAAGQRDVAADLFAEALSLDPNSRSARDGLAQARSRALSAWFLVRACLVDLGVPSRHTAP